MLGDVDIAVEDCFQIGHNTGAQDGINCDFYPFLRGLDEMLAVCFPARTCTSQMG